MNLAIEKEGYLPKAKDSDDFSVQWCNGSPGAIPLFLAALDLFPMYRLELIKVAEVCGEVTWEKGMVLKGTGLCHGIAGNAIMLHSLYRKFNELAK